eukprot:343572-Prymnesium_polylepis.1
MACAPLGAGLCAVPRVERGFPMTRRKHAQFCGCSADERCSRLGAIVACPDPHAAKRVRGG